MRGRAARGAPGFRLLAAALLTATASLSPMPAGAAPATVTRLGGADRYATAAVVSASSIVAPASVAFLATGLDFPDALTAGPAAARRHAPVLLTDPLDLPAATADELTRLQPAEIVVLGGPGAISNAVVSQLEAYTSGPVTRLAGPDRYATAALISTTYFAAGAPVAYVATGRNFPDALAAGTAAGALGGPVLLVDGTSIPSSVQAELTRLKPARIVVAGGAGVVSDIVLNGLKAFTAGSVTRQAGADRFTTAAAISAGAFPKASVVHIANGLGFADAVAGAPAAAIAGGPLLLALSTSVPSATTSELRRLTPTTVVLLGGQAALADSIIPTIRDATSWVRVGPHSFRVDAYRLRAVPPDLFAFNNTTLLSLYGTRDSTGAFIYRHTDGKWYDHPVGQALYVVNMLRNYRLKPDPLYLDLALANANRLLGRAIHYGGGMFFPYPFDFVLHGRGTMEAPWYSGMAQGVALSGFIRLHELTGDPKWLQAANETFASFKVPRQAGKPWFAVVEDGLLWFEEYPWVPYDHTFNGHNFAAYGLYDYWRFTNSPEAEQLLLGAITTTSRVASLVRVPGGVSQYCIALSCLDRHVRSTDYHLTHIGQFIQIYRYTAHERFASLADAFTADFPNFRTGGTVVFQPGLHVGYRFDSTGIGTPVRSATLTASSNAPYTQRTVPYGWIRPGNGIWFLVSDGTFAGLWIHESAIAYARGFVDQLNYYWPRSLAIAAGSRTGYQYDVNGAIVDQLTVSADAGSWGYVAKAKINGRLAAYLSSGPVAGYWLTVASTGTASLSLTSDPLAAIDETIIPPPMPGEQELGPLDGSAVQLAPPAPPPP